MTFIRRSYSALFATGNASVKIYGTAGNFTETIPRNVKTMTVEIWGGGGGGGGAISPSPFIPQGVPGGGGGSGAYIRATYPIKISEWGQTVAVNVGSAGSGGASGAGTGVNGGSSNISPGTYSLPTGLTNSGGGGGAPGASPGANGIYSITVVTSEIQQSANGNSGGAGASGNPGLGGSAIASPFPPGVGYGAGGNGGTPVSLPGFTGGVGNVIFRYT